MSIGYDRVFENYLMKIFKSSDWQWVCWWVLWSERKLTPESSINYVQSALL